MVNLQHYSCARSVRILDSDKIRLCGENAGLSIHFNEGSPFQLQWGWLPHNLNLWRNVAQRHFVLANHKRW